MLKQDIGVETPAQISQWSDRNGQFIFNASPNVLLVVDRDAHILDANHAALECLGLPLEEARGRRWTEFLTPESGTRLLENLNRLSPDQASIQGLSVEMINPRGAKAGISAASYYELDLIVIPEPASFQTVLAIARDQTENIRREHKLHDTQAQYLAVLEKTEEITFHLDMNGEVVFMSPSISTFGPTPDEFIGRNVFYFLGSDEMQTLRGAIERSLNGSNQSLEFTIKNSKEPKHHQVHLWLRPLLDEEKQVGVRGTLTDLGPAHEIDLALERRAAQLTSLNAMGREISAALNEDEVLSRAVRLLREYFGFFFVSIFTPNSENNALVLRASSGPDQIGEMRGITLAVEKGLVGWAAENRRSILANDVRDDPLYVNILPERFQIRSELSLPVLDFDKTVAVIDLQSPLQNAFNQDDIRVVDTFTTFLAVALRNARLYQESQQRLRDREHAETILRTQRDMLAAVGQTLDFPSALKSILAILEPFHVFDCGSIYLVDSSGGLRSVAEQGLTPEFSAAVAYLPPEARKTRMVLLGRPIYSAYSDLDLDPRIPSGVRQREAMLSLATIPIHSQEKVIACLTLGSHLTNAIPMELRTTLEAVTEQLGTVIKRLDAERDLAQNLVRNRAMLEALPDFMFVFDAQGCFLSAKPSADTSFVAPPEVFLGRHIAEILPPDVAMRSLEMIRRALETRQVQEFEYMLSISPGTTEYFETRMSAAGEDQVIALVRNITKRRLAEEQLQKSSLLYRALFEKNKDGVLILSPEGKYISANQSALQMLGCTAETIQGESYLRTVADEDREKVIEFFRLILSGINIPVYERTVVRFDGTTFRAEVNTALIAAPDGTPLHVQTILHPVGARE